MKYVVYLRTNRKSNINLCSLMQSIQIEEYINSIKYGRNWKFHKKNQDVGSAETYTLQKNTGRGLEKELKIGK